MALTNVTEEAFQDTASQVIFFQEKPVLKEVIETVEEMSECSYGPRTKPERKKKKRRISKYSRSGDNPIPDDQIPL